MRPTASIAVPTSGRAGYLEVALRSLAPQAQQAGAELIVVSDGGDPDTAAIAQRHGARLIVLPERSGLNAARNAAIESAAGEVIAFVDDDVEVPDGWLTAMLEGVASEPGCDVFGGPIRARLEGGGPRACGREPPPITTLDLGVEDRDAPFVWGANLAIRRAAFDRVGPFDERLRDRGDEEEWEQRYAALGGRIRYLAAAGLTHRRSRADATLGRLSRAAYALGQTARRNDVRKGTPPSLPRELLTLLGCGWHALRRRCAYGLVFGAHAAGRVREALRAIAPPETSQAPREDFLSGDSGLLVGVRRTTRALLADAVADAATVALRIRPRLAKATPSAPSRRVLVLSIEAGRPNLVDASARELQASRHHVDQLVTAAGARGKFENLNLLLERTPPDGYDWLLVVDDDVALPPGFLDSFLYLAERFELRLAQPAHRHRSHSAWAVTRRRPGSLVRETPFVEIGPVTAFHRDTFTTLLPFPSLRAGWGLDVHWAALARERGWRLGVVDATPIRHGLRPVAAGYDRGAAIAEAREFLSRRPYLTAAEAQRTLVTHWGWR